MKLVKQSYHNESCPSKWPMDVYIIPNYVNMYIFTSFIFSSFISYLLTWINIRMPYSYIGPLSVALNHTNRGWIVITNWKWLFLPLWPVVQLFNINILNTHTHTPLIDKSAIYHGCNYIESFNLNSLHIFLKFEISISSTWLIYEYFDFICLIGNIRKLIICLQYWLYIEPCSNIQ